MQEKIEVLFVLREIKDQGGTIQSGDLGAVANPFRQIRYLAIRGERYSDYTQVELRLHAMGVYAGAQTSVPEPEDKDGTFDGRVDFTSQLATDLINLQSTTASYTSVYWTGPWPILHVVINWVPIEGSLIKLHFGFELLPPYIHLYIDDSEIRCFVVISESLCIAEAEETAAYIAAANNVEAILNVEWFYIAFITRVAMTILGWICPGNPSLMAAFYAASVVYSTAIVLGVMQTLLWISEGAVSVLEGVLSLIFMGLSQIIPFGLIGPACSLWLVDRELNLFELANGLVSDNRLIQLNQKAGMSLFSLWLTFVMGIFMISSALLIALTYGTE